MSMVPAIDVMTLIFALAIIGATIALIRDVIRRALYRLIVRRDERRSTLRGVPGRGRH